MSFPTSDTAILRDLATRYAAAAAEPINAERHAAWNARNKLQAGRPLLHIYQVPWQEFPDCAPQCTDPLAREVETRMRRELWQWNHFPGDMVLPRSWPCPMAIDSGHFGIKHAIEDSKQDRGAVHYNSVVHSIDDIALITDPVVSHDATESQRRLTCLEQAFGDIMPVVLRGIDHGSISAWDAIIHFYSIDDLMMDMIDRPKFVHALVLRYTEACLAQWRQLVDQGLVTTSDGIYEIGNGGLAICDQLPGFDGSVRPCTGREIWGRSMAQIFSDVSPAMHEEFALRYEIM
nr:hypothetical protein [Planctomycetota bacterium]